ncbi:hypothetical protein HOLleu_31887 [Holothuria leucospilota]|uniref:Uncharacterized protein n=1 Tax=Holothuria leucospilota TaxID=206669 RepID=A0A9Q0YR24_HOLLE|nr:hypothetical protein HOLleu_31887 [Holothuria leucospilota]
MSENLFKMISPVMCYSEKMYPIVFGGVQRSSKVTRGQTLKTLLTQYLKGESLDRFYT